MDMASMRSGPTVVGRSQHCMAGRPLLSRSSSYQQGKGLEYIGLTDVHLVKTIYLPQGKLWSRKILVLMLQVAWTYLPQVVL